MSDQSPSKGRVSQMRGRKIMQTRKQRHSEGNYSDDGGARPTLARVNRRRKPVRRSEGALSPVVADGPGLSGKSLYEASTPTRSRFHGKRKRNAASSPLKRDVTQKQEQLFDGPSAPTMSLQNKRKYANGDLEMDAVTERSGTRPTKRHCRGLHENLTEEERVLWEASLEATVLRSRVRQSTSPQERNPLWQPSGKSKRYQNWFGTPPKLLDWHMPGLLGPLQGKYLAPIRNPLAIRLTSPNRTPFARQYKHATSAKVRSVAANTWNSPKPEQTFEYLSVSTDLASVIHTSHTKIGLFGSREEYIELTDHRLSNENCSWGVFCLDRDFKRAGKEGTSSSHIAIEKGPKHSLTFEKPEESFTDTFLSTDIKFDNCCAMSDSDSDSQWSTDGWKMAAMLRGDTGFDVDNRSEVQYINTLWTLPKASIPISRSSNYEDEARNGDSSSALLGPQGSMIKSALKKDVFMGNEDDKNVSQAEKLEGQFVRCGSEESWSVFMEANHEHITSIEEEPDSDLRFLNQHNTEETGGDITDWVWSQSEEVLHAMESAGIYGPMRMRGGAGGSSTGSSSAEEDEEDDDDEGEVDMIIHPSERKLPNKENKLAGHASDSLASLPDRGVFGEVENDSTSIGGIAPRRPIEGVLPVPSLEVEETVERIMACLRRWDDTGVVGGPDHVQNDEVVLGRGEPVQTNPSAGTLAELPANNSSRDNAGRLANSPEAVVPDENDRALSDDGAMANAKRQKKTKRRAAFQIRPSDDLRKSALAASTILQMQRRT